jgi:hypothetical protein
MQTKTILALFCTIVVLLIGVNDGAPATPQPLASNNLQPLTAKTPQPLPSNNLQPLTAKTPQPLPSNSLQPLTAKPPLQPLTAKPRQGLTSKPLQSVGVIQPVTTRAGGRTQWKTTIDSKSKKLFNDNKKIISKKLQSVHQVPTTFNPKPEKTASQIVSGVLFHYLVKLPNQKYAYVTISHQPWKKPQAGNEDHVTVRPQLYALNDKNI